MTLFSRAARRTGIVLAATALLLGTTAGIAAAHVTVNPGEAEAGSYAKLTFRVPNESAEASTTSVSIALPTDHPFPNISFMPVPGWTAALTTVPLDPPVTEGHFTLDKATDSITWTAEDGGGIAPGQFMEFAISVGPVPEVKSLVMPATQTYSDGTVVTWGDVAAEGEDPHSVDHPAPVLTITEGSGHDAHMPESLDDRSTTTDATAQLLGALGLAISVVALAVAVIALLRRRRAQ